MLINIEKLGDCRANLTMEIPAEQLEVAKDRVFARQSRDKNHAGKTSFAQAGELRGRAGRKAVEEAEGEDIFFDAALELILPDVFEDACMESGLYPMGEPEFHIPETKPGQPVLVEATMTYEPEVILGQYIGLEIGEELFAVTDAEVNAALMEVQRQHPVKKEVDGKIKLFLPELTDEFVHEVSQFATVDDYKDYIRYCMTAQKKKEMKQEKEDALMEMIRNNSEVEVPLSMIGDRADVLCQQYLGQTAAQFKMTEDEFLEKIHRTREDFMSECTAAAKDQLQREFILDAIAEAEGLTISDKEMDAAFHDMANQYQMDFEEIRSECTANPQMVKAMKQDLARQKALDFVCEKAIIK